MTFEQERALNNLKTITTRLCNDTDFVMRAIRDACKAFEMEDNWSKEIVYLIDCAGIDLNRLYIDLIKRSTTEEAQGNDNSK